MVTNGREINLEVCRNSEGVEPGPTVNTSGWWSEQELC